MITNQARPHIDGDVQEQQADLSIEEASQACAVQAGFIIELIEEGVIAPVAGDEVTGWRFTETQMQRVRVAWRLQRDLGVNLAGAALALQLLDELETLRAQTSL
jgi:chaperone modulatory protein CbpM